MSAHFIGLWGNHRRRLDLHLLHRVCHMSTCAGNISRKCRIFHKHIAHMYIYTEHMNTIPREIFQERNAELLMHSLRLGVNLRNLSTVMTKYWWSRLIFRSIKSSDFIFPAPERDIITWLAPDSLESRKMRNTYEPQRDGKIQITILILRRGPYSIHKINFCWPSWFWFQ